jgi:hypothetical protein
MSHHAIHPAKMLLLATVSGVYLFQSTGRADVVLPGYDLFTTDASSSFGGLNWQGVPLETYNFGGSIGMQNVGETDTIIQRLGTSGNGQTVDLQMDSLNLKSTTPVLPGVFLFASLDPGETSSGSITINANGTYVSALSVNFDIHAGAANGPVVETTTLDLDGSGVWTHAAPAGAISIPGVNYKLDGQDTDEDFWIDQIDESSAGSAHHVASVAMPEPSGLPVTSAGVLGLLVFAGWERWRQRMGRA